MSWSAGFGCFNHIDNFDNFWRRYRRREGKTFYLLIMCSNIHFVLLPLIVVDNPSIINHLKFTDSYECLMCYAFFCSVCELNVWFGCILIAFTHKARNSSTFSIFDYMFDVLFCTQKLHHRQNMNSDSHLSESEHGNEQSEWEKKNIKCHRTWSHLNIRIFHQLTMSSYSNIESYKILRNHNERLTALDFFFITAILKWRIIEWQLKQLKSLSVVFSHSLAMNWTQN